MTTVIFSLLVFVCVFLGGMLGMFLGPRLPDQHVTSESRDVVRLGMGLVATTVALVLGLLVASAKTYYDTQYNEITQLAANVVLLDRILAHDGPDAAETRAALLTAATGWSEILAPNSASRKGEFLLDKIQERAPKDDNQSNLKAQASNLAIRMGQTRWLMSAQKTIPVPKPLLVMLISWLTILFVSFGLFAPRNFTVQAGLFISALAVSGAIFLILEMYHPRSGLIQVSDAPLRAAIAQLDQ